MQNILFCPVFTAFGTPVIGPLLNMNDLNHSHLEGEKNNGLATGWDKCELSNLFVTSQRAGFQNCIF